MAFWNKKSGSKNGRELPAEWAAPSIDVNPLPPAPAGSPSSPSNDDLQDTLDTILDALGGVVQAFGHDAFDLGDLHASAFRDECDQWARHLLVGASPPDAPPPADESAPREAYPLRRRRFQRVKQFVADRRKKEKRAVGSSLSGLKSIFVDALSSLRQVISNDAMFDNEIGRQVELLRQLSESESIEAVREHLQSTVRMIGTALEQRQQHNETQMRQLGAQIQAIRQELLDTRREMDEDPLTSTFNRRAFDQAIEKNVDIAAFVGEPLSLLVLDLDRFKETNDEYGHLAGDYALRVFGSVLIKCFPRRDDFVARYGGDEFAVLLPDTDLDTALRLAQRFQDALGEVVCEYEGRAIALSCSIGVATLAHMEKAADFFSRADQALYQAKESGRNCCVKA